MSLPARKIEAEVFMVDQAVLEDRVDRIQVDVSEIKQDLRQVGKELVSTRLEVADLRTDMAKQGKELAGAIAALDTKFTSAIGALETKLAAMGGSLIK
jgi:regulator of replication initiation timing